MPLSYDSCTQNFENYTWPSLDILSHFGYGLNPEPVTSHSQLHLTPKLLCFQNTFADRLVTFTNADLGLDDY